MSGGAGRLSSLAPGPIGDARACIRTSDEIGLKCVPPSRWERWWTCTVRSTGRRSSISSTNEMSSWEPSLKVASWVYGLCTRSAWRNVLVTPSLQSRSPVSAKLIVRIVGKGGFGPLDFSTRLLTNLWGRFFFKSRCQRYFSDTRVGYKA